MNLKRGESTCQYSQEAQTQSQPVKVEGAKNLLQEQFYKIIFFVDWHLDKNVFLEKFLVYKNIIGGDENFFNTN